MQCFNNLTISVSLLCLICFAKPFTADNKLSSAASGREKEKKKRKERA
jgi:hypothetical protein